MQMLSPRKSTMCAALLLLCGIQMFAASDARAQRKVSEKDSIEIQMEAVDALRQFQYQYFTLLLEPRRKDEAGQAAPIYGTCEIRVVDFCYGPLNGKLKLGAIGTHVAQGVFADSTMPKVWKRRSDLYVNRYAGVLTRLQRRIPGDRWINGELVRLHVEHGYPDRARDAAAKCVDASWWCHALRAYVVHAGGSWRAADSAWSVALSRMSSEEKCTWLDPTPLIEDRKERESFAESSCAEQAIPVERFWWLSDPFLSVPGNERRSAHLSRNLAMILDNATQQRVYATLAMVREGMVEKLADLKMVDPGIALLHSCGFYGSGEHTKEPVTLLHGYPELVVRVGIPSYCGLIDEPGPIPSSAVSASGRGLAINPQDAPRRVQFTQYPVTRHAFVPRTEALSSHLKALPDDWNLRDPKAFEFLAGWERPILNLRHQAAWFKRADSARFVVLAEEAPQELPKDLARPIFNQMNGVLWLQSDYNQPGISVSVKGTTRLLFDHTMIPGAFLASIESEFPRGPFGRVRFGTAPQEMPAQRVTLSDVMLVEDLGGLPANLEEAAKRALTTTVLREGATTGLFWEIYGLRQGETPRMSLLVVPQTGREPLRVGRIAARPAGPDAIVTEWDEPAVAGRAIEPRTINLNLATLRRGRYTLSLAISVPGQEIVESVRTIEIIR